MTGRGTEVQSRNFEQLMAETRELASRTAGRGGLWGTRDRRKTVRIESGVSGVIVILSRLGMGFILGYMLATGLSLLGIPLILHSFIAVDALALGLIGAVVALTPIRWILWVAHAAVIATAITIGHTPLIVDPVRSSVRADPLPNTPVDAVLVLSSGLSEDGMLDVEGMDRLLTGARLVRDGKSSNLVISRLRRRNSVVSDQDQQRVFELLPQTPRVQYVDSVLSTHDEAVRMAALARTEGWKRVALVTSPLHTRRACATFEKAGLEVICTPSESRDVALSSLSTRHDKLKAFQLWAYEQLATWRYRRANWIR